MSFVAEYLIADWFVHSATLESPVSGILDENDQPEGGWNEPETIETCRLRDMSVSLMIQARSQGIEQASFVLLVPWDTVVQRGARITDVIFRPDHERAGESVDAGPFEVVGVLMQRSKTDEYRQLLLERYR